MTPIYNQNDNHHYFCKTMTLCKHRVVQTECESWCCRESRANPAFLSSLILLEVILAGCIGMSPFTKCHLMSYDTKN